MSNASKKRKLGEIKETEHLDSTNLDALDSDGKRRPQNSRASSPHPSPPTQRTPVPGPSHTQALPADPKMGTTTDDGDNHTSTNASDASKQRIKINKLVPPRPFPTVPAGVNATGPKSAHHQGKNYIAITRKTDLGSYLRRIKDLVVKDGYKSLHLSALGAAIPHLMTLAVSIPAVLPFSPDELRIETLTGTVEVQDELIPDDDDEDISYRTRGKSSVSVVIIIGDGIDEKVDGGTKWGPRGKRRKRGPPPGATQVGKKGGDQIAARSPGNTDIMDESG